MRSRSLSAERPTAPRLLATVPKMLGGIGEVEDARALLAEVVLLLARDLLGEAHVHVGVGVVARDVLQAGAELVPLRVVGLAAARVLGDRLLHRLAELVRLAPAAHRDDGELRGKLLVEEEVVERGDELALREVAARAEDHDEGGRHGGLDHVLDLRVDGLDVELFVVLSARQSGRFAARSHLVWKRACLVDALVGVGAEEVALALGEVGGEPLGAVGVEVGERRREGGGGDAVRRCMLIVDRTSAPMRPRRSRRRTRST